MKKKVEIVEEPQATYTQEKMDVVSTKAQQLQEEFAIYKDSYKTN